MDARPCGRSRERWVGTWSLVRVRTEPASASFQHGAYHKLGLQRSRQFVCKSMNIHWPRQHGDLLFSCISPRCRHLIGAGHGLVRPLQAEFYGIGGVPVALDRTAREETFITSWVA